MDVQKTASEYHKAHLNIIPIEHGGKRPLVAWKQYQSRPQTQNEIIELFPDDRRNIGVLGGECSDNFVALDFDSRGSMRDLLEHNSAFARITSETPTVRTHRGGHVWIRTPVPVKGGRISALNLDIKGSGGYVMAPPSLHKSGHLYLFEENFSNIYRLKSLDELNFLSLIEVNADRPLYYGLGKSKFDILRGDTVGYNSRSEADAAVVLTCIKNGWSFEQIHELYRRYAVEGTRFAESGVDYLYRTFKTGEQHWKENRRKIDVDILEAIESIQHIPLNSRTLHTDRAVLRAVLEIARRTGKLEDIHLAQREIAELSGTTDETARKALKRIAQIELTELATSLSPAKYKISLNVKSCHTSISGSHEGMANYAVKPSHDVWRWSGLGKTGMSVVDVMRVGEYKTIKQLVKDSDVSSRSVERKIQLLERYHLVIGTRGKRDRKYTLTGEMTEQVLDDLAQKIGTAGIGSLQRKQHKAEQTAQRWWRETNREEETA